MNLRLYAFTNFYLGSMQHGIQTGHAAVKLVRKYSAYGGQELSMQNMTIDWADNHQTFITLNGGNHEDLCDIQAFIEKSDYPHVSFNEDQASLAGMLTCVAVVLPESIYAATTYRSASEVGMGLIYPSYEYKFWEQDEERTRMYYPTEPETAMISLIKSRRLAQ
jgi:hypothetical protein